MRSSIRDLLVLLRAHLDPAARRAVAVLANDPRSVDRIGQLLLEPPPRDDQGMEVRSG